jgi:hypothetical protein
MALTKINNNTLSAVTTLPAAIATGKVLQVVTLYLATGNVTTTSDQFCRCYWNVFSYYTINNFIKNHTYNY